jgi:hypothetical protein
VKAATRRRLPASSFAYPSVRKYPINTKARARNALARAAQSKTYGTYGHVARRVKARYGSAIKVSGTRRKR